MVITYRIYNIWYINFHIPKYSKLIYCMHTNRTGHINLYKKYQIFNFLLKYNNLRKKLCPFANLANFFLNKTPACLTILWAFGPENQYINFNWPYRILQDAARMYLLNSTGCNIWVKSWSTSSLSESVSLLLLSNLFHELGSESTLSSTLVNLNHLDGILKGHFEFFFLLPKYIINWSWRETRSANL